MKTINIRCIPDPALHRAFIVPGGVNVEFENHEGVWVATITETGNFGYDYDQQQALLNCLEDFASCYHNIAEESGDRLEGVALQLQKKLLGLNVQILDLPTFVDQLAREQIDLDPEIAKLVDENFWELF